MSVNLKRLQTPFRKDGPNGDPLSSQSPRNKKPRLTTAPASTLDSINFPLMETLDVHVPLTFSATQPLAMGKATHLLTLCKRHCALQRGALCLIPYIINLLGAADPITQHVSAPKMIPQDDALCGLPVKRLKLGDCVMTEHH